MLEATKFTKKESLSIFLIAKEASEGIFGDSLIICKATSFTLSTKALNSLSPLAGFVY